METPKGIFHIESPVDLVDLDLSKRFRQLVGIVAPILAGTSIFLCSSLNLYV
jgi:hypothetical protein